MGNRYKKSANYELPVICAKIVFYVGLYGAAQVPVKTDRRYAFQPRFIVTQVANR